MVLLESKCNPEDASALVSVIIATYRRDKSLKKALLSVINQTYKKIEVIVVDDNADHGWNKKVSDVVEEIQYSHPLIYIQNSVNKGSAETRNIGIKKATGEYITFLDDDDIYLPDKVKNQVEFVLRENSDYCITDLELYDENDRLIEKRTRNYISQKEKGDLLRYHMLYHMTGTDTLMFKREYLVKIGAFPKIDVGDEFYLMENAIEAGGVFSYIPICDIKAYVHSETEGLSSGDSKVLGENKLFQYKKKYFDRLSFRDRQYIVMRHYAVLAFAQIRRRKYFSFFKYSLLSFVSSPISCIRLILRKG